MDGFFSQQKRQSSFTAGEGSQNPQAWVGADLDLAHTRSYFRMLTNPLWSMYAWAGSLYNRPPQRSLLISPLVVHHHEAQVPRLRERTRIFGNFLSSIGEAESPRGLHGANERGQCSTDLVTSRDRWESLARDPPPQHRLVARTERASQARGQGSTGISSPWTSS